MIETSHRPLSELRLEVMRIIAQSEETTFDANLVDVAPDTATLVSTRVQTQLAYRRLIAMNGRTRHTICCRRNSPAPSIAAKLPSQK